MKRREFLKHSLLATGAAALASTSNLASAAESEPATREFYELRLYHLRRGPKQKLFDDFFRDAAIPALHRAGLGPVGVFSVVLGPDSPTMYVLLPHSSKELMSSASARLESDQEYLKAGAAFLNAPATDPAYVRVESSLLVAFESAPKTTLPAAASGAKPRMFELRTYESHSQKANLKKIEMFNSGEVAIFRRAGFQPVFFGETLIGSRLPNLTYMLAFENMAERDKSWAAFGADPEWKRLTGIYNDSEIVSDISNLILRATPYSQI